MSRIEMQADLIDGAIKKKGSLSYVPMGEVCNFIGGSQPPKQEFVYEPLPGYIRLIQIQDYKSDKKKTFIPKSKARRFCTKEDVMIGRYGPPIFQILRGLEGAYNVALMKAAPKDEKVLDREYLYYFLHNPSLFNYVVANSERTAGQDGLRKELLEDYAIPLPPIEEQRRIAAILDKADAVRRKRKEAIALTEELLRSQFLEMFGDPVTNPKGWDMVPLGDISKVKGGLQVTPKRKDNPIEVPYLRVANVYRDQLVLDEVKLIRVTPEELERTALCTGDLLIVEGHGNSQEIGRSSVWDGSISNCTHQNHLIRVTLDSKRAEPTYISAFLNSYGGRRQLIQFGKTTSGLNTISTSNVKATKVLLPPLSEQKKYGELKQNLAVCLGDHQKYFQSTNDLFNSLLQRAFRGEL